MRKTMREYAVSMAKCINRDGTANLEYYNILLEYNDHYNAGDKEIAAIKDLSAQISAYEWRNNHE